jgi:hypothetical protein
VKRGIDRDCWVCGNPDWWWREGKRKDAQTCSNRCRQRGYRLRRLAREAIVATDPRFERYPPEHPMWDAAARRVQRMAREPG